MLTERGGALRVNMSTICPEVLAGTGLESVPMESLDLPKEELATPVKSGVNRLGSADSSSKTEPPPAEEPHGKDEVQEDEEPGEENNSSGSDAQPPMAQAVEAPPIAQQDEGAIKVKVKINAK